MMITGFILANITMVVIILGFTIPRYYDAFIPYERRGEGTEPTVAMETKGEIGGAPVSDFVKAEGGQALAYASSQEHTDKGVEHDKETVEPAIR
jgi:solute carrier family 6 GABA transporter-like protein 1